MGGQVHLRECKSAHAEGTTETQPNPEAAAKGREINEKLDDLVDQLDGILEENAEQFLEALALEAA